MGRFASILALIAGCSADAPPMGDEGSSGGTTDAQTSGGSEEEASAGESAEAGSEGGSTTGAESSGGSDSGSDDGDESSTGTGEEVCDDPPPPPGFFWLPGTDNRVYKFDFTNMDRVGTFRMSEDNERNIGTLSVSMSGRVAVGMWSYHGINFIEPYEERCIDHNGEDGIQTSTAFPYDLPYGSDDCVTNIPADGSRTYSNIAWLPSTLDASCEWEDEHLWIAHGAGGGTLDVSLLNADTGEIVEDTSLGDIATATASPAVDGGGNLWLFARDGAENGLVRVDRETLEARKWIFPPPMRQFPTIDSDGYIWLTDWSFPEDVVFRFDPQTEDLEVIEGTAIDRAAAAEADGRLWSGGDGLTAIERSDPFATVVEPNSERGVIGFDFSGNLWFAQDYSGLRKYDLDDLSVELAESPPVSLDPKGDLTGYQITHAGVRLPP